MSEEAPPPPPSPPKKSAATGIIAIALPALLAAGGGFGGARIAGAAASHGAAPAHVTTVVVEHTAPPGPTLTLDAFLVSMTDDAKRPHTMRISLAVELRRGAKEEEFKPFIPRIRDSTLALLRNIAYEDATDAKKMDEARRRLLDRYHQVGAESASAVLITDLVVQ
jgi:flagellar basal body-associated protein FliL